MVVDGMPAFGVRPEETGRSISGWHRAISWRWARAVGVLALAVSLVVVSALALNLSLGRLRDSVAWVQHTDDVLLQVASIDGDLVEAESTERGYLLTGDEAFRQTFQRLQEGLPGKLRDLLTLVADSADQHERLGELRPILQARLDELRQVVALGPAQMTAALAIVQSAKQHELTRTIRNRLETVRQAELDLLHQRQERASSDTRLAIALATGLAVLALVSASIGLMLFQHARNVHREKELRTELIHVSRLNMMGQMASMLAHELTQPLTATGTYLRAALRIMETGDQSQAGRIADAVRQSSAQMDRAREILKRLRTFIQKGEPATTAEPVGPLLDEAVALLGLTRHGVRVSYVMAPALPPVLVDKIQMQQVLINLMRNAVEAMEQSDRRELTLAAATEASGDMRISVHDTGPGLAKEVARRLFQPFVTTKPGGMGVGLSICQTIVAANGGRIWAEPNPGGGTVFRITVPSALPARRHAAAERLMAASD